MWMEWTGQSKILAAPDTQCNCGDSGASGAISKRFECVLPPLKGRLFFSFCFSFCYSTLGSCSGRNVRDFNVHFLFEMLIVGNSLAVQWLGIGTFTVNGLGSILGQGTKILQDVWRASPRQRKSCWQLIQSYILKAKTNLCCRSSLWATFVTLYRNHLNEINFNFISRLYAYVCVKSILEWETDSEVL